MRLSYSLLGIAGAVLFLARPGVGVGDCGCSSCTSSVLNKDAAGHSVRNRIDWVIANKGESEQKACSIGKDSVFFHHWFLQRVGSNIKTCHSLLSICLKFVVVNSLMFVAANAILANAAKSVAALHAPIQFWTGMIMATVSKAALIGWLQIRGNLNRMLVV